MPSICFCLCRRPNGSGVSATELLLYVWLVCLFTYAYHMIIVIALCACVRVCAIFELCNMCRRISHIYRRHTHPYIYVYVISISLIIFICLRHRSTNEREKKKQIQKKSCNKWNNNNNWCVCVWPRYIDTFKCVYYAYVIRRLKAVAFHRNLIWLIFGQSTKKVFLCLTRPKIEPPQNGNGMSKDIWCCLPHV